MSFHLSNKASWSQLTEFTEFHRSHSKSTWGKSCQTGTGSHSQLPGTMGVIKRSFWCIVQTFRKKTSFTLWRAISLKMLASPPLLKFLLMMYYTVGSKTCWNLPSSYWIFPVLLLSSYFQLLGELGQLFNYGDKKDEEKRVVSNFGYIPYSGKIWRIRLQNILVSFKFGDDRYQPHTYNYRYIAIVGEF